MRKGSTYLTDEQYARLLQKLDRLVQQAEKFWVYDDTTIGSKDTTSNCGLCNEDQLTTEDIALFPSDYRKHGRKDMKNRQAHHICPFDTRFDRIVAKMPCNMFNGCYYTCILAKKNNIDKKAVLDRIAILQRMLAESELALRVKQCEELE